jgi:hypothetical protein
VYYIPPLRGDQSKGQVNSMYCCGLTMLAGLKALQTEPATGMLLISQPPSPSIGRRVLEQAETSDKPTTYR